MDLIHSSHRSLLGLHFTLRLMDQSILRIDNVEDALQAMFVPYSFMLVPDTIAFRMRRHISQRVKSEFIGHVLMLSMMQHSAIGGTDNLLAPQGLQ